jgi:hypothetical protein
MPMRSAHDIILGLPDMRAWHVKIDTVRGSLVGHWGRPFVHTVHSLEAVDEKLPLTASLVITDGRRVLARAEHGRPELPITYVYTTPEGSGEPSGVSRLMAKLGVTGHLTDLKPRAVFKCCHGAGDFLQLLYCISGVGKCYL